MLKNILRPILLFVFFKILLSSAIYLALEPMVERELGKDKHATNITSTVIAGSVEEAVWHRKIIWHTVSLMWQKSFIFISMAISAILAFAIEVSVFQRKVVTCSPVGPLFEWRVHHRGDGHEKVKIH